MKKLLLISFLLMLSVLVTAQETGNSGVGEENIFSFLESAWNTLSELIFGISEFQIELIIFGIVLLFGIYLLRAKLLVLLNFLQDGTMILIIIIIVAIIVIFFYPDAITGVFSG